MLMITTTKEINLAQLDIELGSHGLSMEDKGTTRTITPKPDSPTTDAQLQAGIDAHVPVVYIDPAIAAKASRDAKLAKMGFTAAEIENW